MAGDAEVDFVPPGMAREGNQCFVRVGVAINLLVDLLSRDALSDP